MESPVEVLQQMLERGEEIEHTFLTSKDFFDAERDEFDDALDDYVSKYEDLVRVFARQWGPPSFDDGMGNRKFPKWYEAEFLACWPKGDRTAYVALRHDDKELPLLLVYGIKNEIAPSSGVAGNAGKALEKEARRLLERVCGKTVMNVRKPTKNVLVLEFQGGGFITVRVYRSQLVIELPGESE